VVDRVVENGRRGLWRKVGNLGGGGRGREGRGKCWGVRGRVTERVGIGGVGGKGEEGKTNVLNRKVGGNRCTGEEGFFRSTLPSGEKRILCAHFRGKTKKIFAVGA